MEDRFDGDQDDVNNLFILSNMNPIKTACHLLMLMSEFESRYSMASLRTESLYEAILSQARSVLDKLFFPKQMKWQLKSVDLMNRNSLYYLEHLDAFSIMQSHIMDRVM